MKVRIALALATTLTATTAFAQAPAKQPEASAPLEQQFRDPPAEARPRVWWHWMNGNISKEGIAKDLAWMKRVGIGGLQNFDINLSTPQIVDKRLVYMTPEWKDAFRFAASEAERLGLELAIASSPGFSETGGPWVKPKDGLKKLVWSETEVLGGKPLAGPLAAPPSATGPFQAVDQRSSIAAAMGGELKSPPSHYADVAVLAFPVSDAATAQPVQVLGSDGKQVDPAALTDADYSSTVDLPVVTGSDWRPLTFVYDRPQTFRAASLFVPRAWMMFFGSMVEGRLEASDDGSRWREVADVPISGVPTTVSFDPVTARQFRLTVRFKGLDPALMHDTIEGAIDANPMGRVAALGARPIGIGDLRLFTEPRVDVVAP